MSDFYPGEIVYLNSGSPPLTVSDLKRGDGLVPVEWFAGDQHEISAFDARCLTRAPRAAADPSAINWLP